ncbi:MAG: hypothetical protein B9S32_05035 [Verrucomicrobia bacterium Tous-C9LFEB]|nr:MAG: hypothetical protein B9S32_05035 [Verrucomicrobia bacterium Tous-C9LFEB]
MATAGIVLVTNAFILEPGLADLNTQAYKVLELTDNSSINDTNLLAVKAQKTAYNVRPNLIIQCIGGTLLVIGAISLPNPRPKR